ncbi:hypothetical protein E0H73_39325 [Kribbella pittospori]|uniref:Uncharacterized protein n=1 Tax=Kribbella pittospori TaxID=722689 RepID=A0A4R0KFB3_9ACTN|nr:hypothetical protein [Kribbella pittospori]TCC54205.1 hypothetical protein E0H73_39325 [Kribbella pittospori]
MNVVVEYNPETDGAPVVVCSERAGEWLMRCRVCDSDRIEPTQTDAIVMSVVHYIIAEANGCNASKLAEHRRIARSTR